MSLKKSFYHHIRNNAKKKYRKLLVKQNEYTQDITKKWTPKRTEKFHTINLKLEYYEKKAEAARLKARGQKCGWPEKTWKKNKTTTVSTRPKKAHEEKPIKVKKDWTTSSDGYEYAPYKVYEKRLNSIIRLESDIDYYEDSKENFDNPYWGMDVSGLIKNSEEIRDMYRNDVTYIGMRHPEYKEKYKKKHPDYKDTPVWIYLS